MKKVCWHCESEVLYYSVVNSENAFCYAEPEHNINPETTFGPKDRGSLV